MTTYYLDSDEDEEWISRGVSPRQRERMERSAHIESRLGHWDRYRTTDGASEVPTETNSSVQVEPSQGQVEPLPPSPPSLPHIPTLSLHSMSNLSPPFAPPSPPSSPVPESDYYDRELEHEEDSEETLSSWRKVWIAIANVLTFWLPDCLIKCCRKTKESRLAFREKMAIVILIILFSAFFLALFILAPKYSCQQPAIYRWEEINDPHSHRSWYVNNGYLYDGTEIMNFHAVTQLQMAELLGTDISYMFYRPALSVISETCGFQPTSPPNTLPPTLPPSSTPSETPAKRQGPLTLPSNTTQNPIIASGSFEEGYELYRVTSCIYKSSNTTIYVDPLTNQTYYYYCHSFINGTTSPYKVGRLGWTFGELSSLPTTQHWIVVKNRVYNTTNYYQGGFHFLPAHFNSLIYTRDRSDATALYDYLFQNDDYLSCLDYMFDNGIIDTRSYNLCFWVSNILLGIFCIIAAVVAIKTVTSLPYAFPGEFHRKNVYVITCIPCYSENEDSLYRTIHSVATSNYSKKHHLMVIISDGIVTGQKSKLSTPEIALKLLGRKMDECPDSYEYRSTDGKNRVKIFSGRYEEVPYILIIKIGMPEEASKPKPGNRGKRDSQLILFGFLNRLFYGKRMGPVDRKIREIIETDFKIDPHRYELLATTDADSKVHKDWLANFVYHMNSNRRISGACGNTLILNKWGSWITVISVYEYWINHVLNKAFESSFGSVFCNSGVNSILRIKLFPKSEKDREKGKGRVKPILIYEPIISAYSNRNVNALHTRNLLHLGEDRFLTTLLLKYRPDRSTKFIPKSIVWTMVPESWSILLSQRRRWISSTIFNQFYLLGVDLKGIGIFSMKAIIILDLISTFLLPAGLLYLAYLIFSIIYYQTSIPLFVIISICVIFGSQLFLILIRREPSYFGWIIAYLLAFPIWTGVIPLYAFLHLDDFGWGLTQKTQESSGTSPGSGTQQISIKVEAV